MPIPSIDELFDQREAYFGKDQATQWDQAVETKNKQSQVIGVTVNTKESIKRLCDLCIPNDRDYDQNRKLQTGGAARIERGVRDLKDQGQLAFLWAYINDIFTAKESHTDKLKHGKETRERVRYILSGIKAVLLMEMQDAKTLEDLITKQAFLCADLSGMALFGMNLQNADLRHSNLSKCDFRDTSLVDANLRNADLRDADLTEVLSSDKPSGLSGINLCGAKLSGAKYKHSDIMTAGNLYLTRFGELPASYEKNKTEKQELENKIRESYAAVKDGQNPKYNPIFLKLIQASGFSPLMWGDCSDVFEAEHQKWAQRDASQLLAQMKKTLGEMVDPAHERGYAQSRSRDRFKSWFFAPKDSRPGQITELTSLIKGEGDTVKNPTIEEIAEKLLNVSNKIRLEDNKLTSELLTQIESACTHPKVEVKGPTLG